jgi:hypothetical protein
MFIAPANNDSSGGLLPRLRLGLDENAQPHIRIVDSLGQPEFVAPSR